MQINFVYDPSVATAPAGFLGGLAAAAQFVGGLISNPITVTLRVGWGEYQGLPIPANAVAEGGSVDDVEPYSTVRAELAANATTAADAASVAKLPPSDPFPGTSLRVSSAQEKAWGRLPAVAGIDGAIGFSTAYSFTFDPASRAVPGEMDFIGAAEHEITHALGRTSNLLTYPGGSTLDLFRFTAPGVNAQSSAQQAYFSIDGGATSLDPFDTALDPGDWASSVQGDSFGYAQLGAEQAVTPTDMTVMDVLGFSVAPLLTGGYAVTIPSSEPFAFLNGIGQVTLGPGDHTLNVLGGADTIFAASASETTTILNDGAVFFYAGAAPGQAVASVAGPGIATLVGAANNVLIDQNPGAGPGSVMVAGTGNETLFGAASGTDDQYWGGFQGANQLLAAGSGNDILVAGNGADTLIGGGGADTFYLINARLIGAILGAPVRPGQDVIYNAHPGDTIALTGYDSLYGAAAASGAAARSVTAALEAGGPVTLSDGTTITFVGGAGGAHVISS